MSNVQPIREPQSMLTYALKYVAMGWWVLPLIPKNKEPLGKLVPNGVLNASNDPEVIRKWWSAEPMANIGIAAKKSGLVVGDVDPRNNGLDTFEKLESKYGKITSAVEQLTGGGGVHIVWLLEGDYKLPGKLGDGIDLIHDGKYFIAEPSIHPSGGVYQWEASSDPFEGCVPSTLPDWIKDVARSPMGVMPYIAATRMVDAKQVGELRDALSTQSADDYHQWVNYGNALCELGQAGFTLWDEWSQKSSKYDAGAAFRKWKTFKSGVYQLESIFFNAQNDGWVNPASLEAQPVPEVKPVSLETVVVAAPLVVPDAPDSVLKIPGTLGKIAEWIDASSSKSQPKFSIQAALAFGCTVLGRRIVSSNRNWSSLYFLCIGKSGSGKEHGKWAIEKLLSECGLSDLIGPNGYTSSPGVLCSIFDQPSHVTVIDEFGRELEKAAVKQNANSQGMLKTLLEVWGRCDGVIRPQGFSTNGISSKESDSLKNKITHNPALTLYAMTVPDSFFESVGSAAARDGFLNRFVIVESEIGRQPTQFKKKPPVPLEIKEWASEMVSMGAGLVNPTLNPGLEPSAIEIPISDSAMELFAAFEIDCHALMDKYEQHGLGDMFVRSCEIAMRLAMVVSMGMGRKQWGVEAPDAAWAIGYVRYHAKCTVERLLESVSDTDFEAIKKQVYHLILKAGSMGLTERDINKGSRRFRGIDQRQQVNVLNSLKFLGEIDKVVMDAASTGRKRTAWVAVEYGDSGDVPGDSVLSPAETQ